MYPAGTRTVIPESQLLSTVSRTAMWMGKYAKGTIPAAVCALVQVPSRDRQCAINRFSCSANPSEEAGHHRVVVRDSQFHVHGMLFHFLRQTGSWYVNTFDLSEIDMGTLKFVVWHATLDEVVFDL